MKTCAKCKVSKPVAEFGKKLDKLQPYCKPCNNAHTRSYYYQNKEHHLELIKKRSKRYITELRELVREIKNATPCTDCGVQYPWFVLDFDHVQGEKVDIISKMVNERRSKQVLLDEIAKCEVVCSNCHRVRTFTRSGHVANEEELV